MEVAYYLFAANHFLQNAISINPPKELDHLLHQRNINTTTKLNMDDTMDGKAKCPLLISLHISLLLCVFVGRSTKLLDYRYVYYIYPRCTLVTMDYH